MISREQLRPLVFAVPVLLAATTVLFVGHGISSGLGDAAGARVLWWIAMAAVMLLAVDCLILLLAIGAKLLDDR